VEGTTYFPSLGVCEAETETEAEAEAEGSLLEVGLFSFNPTTDYSPLRRLSLTS
jgi:hypothetical protein